MKHRFLIVIAAFACLSCRQAEVHSAESKLINQLDSLFAAEFGNSGFNGSLLIEISDSIVYANHTGVANRTFTVSITDSTRFDIASLNKSFIAALTLIAVEEGHFLLHDRLNSLLRKYHMNSSFNDSITIHQVLCHTSGLPDYDAVQQVSPKLAANNFRQFKRSHFTNEEYVEFINALPPVGKPGKQFHYSNFGYHLLCILLEETYSKHFGLILKEKITKPLNLSYTVCVETNADLIPNLAIAYAVDPETNNWLQNDFIDLTLGRRIFSTTDDLRRWSKAIETSSLLSDSLTQKMLTNQLSQITDRDSYGYGWVIYEQGDAYRMGNLQVDLPYFIHGGQTGGYKSMLVNVNQGSYIIAMLTNAGTQLNETKFIGSIAQIISMSNEH